MQRTREGAREGTREVPTVAPYNPGNYSVRMTHHTLTTMPPPPGQRLDRQRVTAGSGALTVSLHLEGQERVTEDAHAKRCRVAVHVERWVLARTEDTRTKGKREGQERVTEDTHAKRWTVIRHTKRWTVVSRAVDAR